MVSMLDKDDEKDVEVEWDDQQRINTFSKVNTRMHELEKERAALELENEALDDLSTELELADEDQPVLYKIGESFMHIKLPDAMDRLSDEQASLDDRLEKTRGRIKECGYQMDALKVALYAKFGSAINLDE